MNLEEGTNDNEAEMFSYAAATFISFSRRENFFRNFDHLHGKKKEKGEEKEEM